MNLILFLFAESSDSSQDVSTEEESESDQDAEHTAEISGSGIFAPPPFHQAHGGASDDVVVSIYMNDSIYPALSSFMHYLIQGYPALSDFIH